MRMIASSILALLAAACASAQPPPGAALVHDPFERQNRTIFAFNEDFDRAVTGPVARGYESAFPAFARRRVRDFVDHLRTPLWFANDVLQANPASASDQLARFMFNTVFGFAGLYDFASEQVKMDKKPEDFGQTLAVWGLAEGPYLVAPFAGGFTLRDGAGWIADRSLDPLTWFAWDGRAAVLSSRVAFGGLDARVRADSSIERFRRSPDPYVAFRSNYIQHRRGLIAGDDDPFYEDLPDFE